MIVASVLASDVVAQTSRTFGVGVQVGSPGGLTLRRETGDDPAPGVGFRAEALSAILSFDFDGYFLAQGHLENDWTIPDSPVRFYGGPGLITGVDDRSGILGLGLVAGVRFFKGRTEIFIQTVPRLTLLPSLRLFEGGGIGFRYYP